MPTAMEKGAVKFFNTKELANLPADIVCEVPLSLYLNGEKISTIACTGLHLRELAVGFLRSEGLLVTRDEIKDVLVVEGPEPAVYVYASEQSQPRGEVNSIAPGGVMGRDGSRAGLKPFEGVSLKFSPQNILDLMEELQQASVIHEATRGTHCSGLAASSGMILTREDIGRHNTVDMIGGHMLLEGMEGSDRTIVTTGRVSSEIVTKVRAMGVPVIVSHSAPTTRAIVLCRELAMTLIGCVRGGTFRVYTGFE